MELALLPVVESAFNPVAYSRSRASGLWQFIPRTGRHYGLEQNWWIDERRDVIESTQAALTYLQYLHRYFDGDWFLAIAAYNGGEGTVSRARADEARSGRGTGFFDLNLRTETRQYVPKLLAIRRIVADPQAFGLQFAPIPNRPYFDVVDPGRQVHIGNAAEIAGVTPGRHVRAKSGVQPADDSAGRPAPAAAARRACRSPATGDAGPRKRQPALDRGGQRSVGRHAIT